MASISTERQKKLARAIVDNAKKDKPDNKSTLMGKVGYARNTIDRRSAEVFSADGVKKELSNLGFSEDKARTVVGNILSDENIDPNPRLKAADMVFKVFGTYAADKINPNVIPQVIINVLGNPEAKRLSEEMDKILIKNIYDGEIISPIT